MTLKVVVPISGGKDSQACLKLALLTYRPDEVRGLFCDTQFEHPETYKHVEWIGAHYGVQIDRVSGGSVLEKVIKHGRFPGGGARHCTDELKIRETRIYMQGLLREGLAPIEVWYGMRSKESNERKKRYAGKVCSQVYPPHEVMPGKYPKMLGRGGIMFRLAILDWTDADVLGFLAGEEHPFYALGFPRVGCFPCLASGDKWKRKAFRLDGFGREQHRKVIEIATLIDKSPWSNDDNACGVCSI